jgi:hypothetical protein
MKKVNLLLISLIVFCSNARSQNNTPSSNKDAFKEIMGLLNITEDNLGFKPKGYWTRYPIPDDIPYKINSFNDLMAQPQYMFDYVHNMAESVEDFLHPDYLKANFNGIMKIGFYCGIAHLSEQFRGYNSSLWAEVAKEEPLLNAIKEIYLKTNTIYRYNRMAEAADYPLIERDLRTALKKIDPAVQQVVANTLLNLYDAWNFQQIAMRNIDYQKANKVWRIRHLGETQFDGMGYYAELEDCAKSLDINSIYYAGLKLMETSEWLSDTLIKLKNSKLAIDWKNQYLDVETPIGRLVISGTRDDVHKFTDVLLSVDLGGNDTYNGQAGSTPSLQIPVSLAIDLAGNDKYLNEDEYAPSQGAAIFGAAMLLDVTGDDVYSSKRLSQGASMLGIGILADMEGNDKYDMWTDGQGAAYFGVGLAIDNKGDDKYNLWGDGQGYGGVGGVGTLVNRTGNDYYYAEADTSKVYRMDRWHASKGQYNYTYCQGAGIGRRGDVTDGHSWAGGMGTLIDLDGNDQYIAGGWSQACGYWYGMGFLYDRAGNDYYKATHWSQVAGAHFCIAGLFDEGGDDQFIQWEKLATGTGFGHDFTIGIFYNKGGNDTYKMHDDGFGYAINKSQVFFIDTEGDDTYIRGGKGHNYGYNNYEQSNPPGVEMIYHLYSDQISIFADLKGNDKYYTADFPDGKLLADTLMKDGKEYYYPTPEQKQKLASGRYYGIGKDYLDYNGTEIEIFRDKMKKKFAEFK